MGCIQGNCIHGNKSLAARGNNLHDNTKKHGCYEKKLGHNNLKKTVKLGYTLTESNLEIMTIQCSIETNQIPQ